MDGSGDGVIGLGKKDKPGELATLRSEDCVGDLITDGGKTYGLGEGVTDSLRRPEGCGCLFAGVGKVNGPGDEEDVMLRRGDDGSGDLTCWLGKSDRPGEVVVGGLLGVYGSGELM